MFYVIGRGIITKDELINTLREWGIENPLPILKQAEKGSVIVDQYKICGIR